MGGHTCLMSSSWRIRILSLSIWIRWSRSFCCCCCWVVSALGRLISPAGGFWGGWFCWLRVLDAICCWCWWFITTGGKNIKAINDKGLQHLIKKRPSECVVLWSTDSWDSFQSTSLLIITVQVIITLIQFRETQIVAPLLTHSVSAFVLVRILFHIFPASRVTFEAFHRIQWPKMDSTKFPTTYEIISPGHLVCVLLFRQPVCLWQS